MPNKLNSSTFQLQVSKFELRLLSYFHHIYLKQHTNEQPALDRVWKFEVPILWQQLELVRHSIFSLSAMILWNVCDLEDIYRKDCASDGYTYHGGGKSDFSKGLEYLTNDQNRINLSNSKEELGVDVSNVQELKELFYTKLADYFAKSLKKTYSVMESIQSLDMMVTTQFQAAEIVISGILLFLFLALQPHGLVTMLSDDDTQADLLSMIKGMKISMGKSFPLLYDSGFNGLFHASEHLDPPTLTEKDVYPMVESLRSELKEYLQDKLTSDGTPTVQGEDLEAKWLTQAIDLLEIVFYRTIEELKPLPLFRYLFLIDIWIYDQAKYSKHIFCLKLIFVYLSLCSMSKLRLFSHANIFNDYLHWYKMHNFESYGGWRYPDDAALYDLIIHKGFEINNNNFKILLDFDPLKYNENDIVTDYE